MPGQLGGGIGWQVVKLNEGSGCRSRADDEILPCSSCGLELRGDAAPELVNAAVRLKAPWDFVAIHVGHGDIESLHANALKSVEHV
jgi:hypothetical protein